MTQPDFSSLIDANPSQELTTIQNSSEVAQWSYDKKKDFTDTFDARTRVARFILMETGYSILKTALTRRFIGLHHIPQVLPDSKSNPEYALSYWDSRHLCDPVPAPVEHDHRRLLMIGGRSLEDLKKVALERAETILKELPPIKAAVAIIDPDTAKLIDKRDLLLEKARALTPKLEELSEPIKMSEVDPKMTIGAFRIMVKGQEKQREVIIRRLNTIGQEGTDLEDTINKKLFRGLPGLAEAVLDVAKNHIERANMFDQLNRRVGEVVRFGDSKEAMDLLKKFEQDETTLSKDVKAMFQAALEKLKLSKPQLKGKK
jgi:hypothetical protein